MNTRTAIAFALLCAPFVAARGQSILGRVVDSSGTPIPHARVLVHPAGDSSDVVSHVAATNARGDFAFADLAPGTYVLRVRRIGLVPEPDQRAVVGAGAAARITITIRAIALPLPTVLVTTPKVMHCRDVDDPAQNEVVRAWIIDALGQLRMRRVLDRDVTYDVSVRGGRSPMRFTHQAGARVKDTLQDAIVDLTDVGRDIAARGRLAVLPSETTFLTSGF